MIATLCFAEDASALFREAARVLRADGKLLIGDIPADSSWGREYQRKQEAGHSFNRSARFYTVEQLVAMLADAGFRTVGFSSTLTHRHSRHRRRSCPSPLWQVMRALS